MNFNSISLNVSEIKAVDLTKVSFFLKKYGTLKIYHYKVFGSTKWTIVSVNWKYCFNELDETLVFNVRILSLK